MQTGSTVGDYKVLGTLGAGGMGRVYKVQNQITQRIEALKILLPDVDAEGELADRFMREIQVQASLSHRNIAALHTALRLENQLMMVMELVEGETLERRLTQGKLPLHQALEFSDQLLDALHYAHQRNVIHRDIKPANIIVTPEGTAKLMDFGLAAAGADKRLTKTGAVLGSLLYMSPEQVKGEVPSQRSDIYSFGLNLYEMLTGVRGIQGDSEYAIMTAHLMFSPEAPRQLNPEIPAGLSDVVLRAIAKDPSQRFETAAAFRTALKDYALTTATYTMIAPNAAITAMSAAATLSASAPMPATRSRMSAVVIGGVIGLGVVIAAGLYLRKSPTNQPASPAIATPAKQESPVSESTPPTQAAPVVADKPIAASQNATSVPVVAPSSTSTQPVKVETPAAPKAFLPPPTQAAPARTVLPEPPPAVPVVTAPAPVAVSLPAPKVEKSAQQIQNEDWDAARNSRDLAKLQEFRRKYPDGPLSQQALILMADIEWTPLKQSRDPKSLRDFQSRYAVSPHAAEAGAAADRLERESANREIADVLQRYGAAYAAKDMNQVRALWPNAGRDALNKIESFFKIARSVTLNLQPSGDPAINGDKAVVQAKASLTAQMTDNSRQSNNNTATVHLSRTRGAWLIDDLEYK